MNRLSKVLGFRQSYRTAVEFILYIAIETEFITFNCCRDRGHDFVGDTIRLGRFDYYAFKLSREGMFRVIN